MQIARLDQVARLVGIGRQVQVGEQHLAVAQHAALDRLRLLDLDDHLGAGEHLGRRADDGRAGALVVGIGRADAGAGLRLHQHRVAVRNDLAHRRRRQADAVLMDLDLFRNADLHWTVSGRVAGAAWLDGVITPRAGRRCCRCPCRAASRRSPTRRCASRWGRWRRCSRRGRFPPASACRDRGCSRALAPSHRRP